MRHRVVALDGETTRTIDAEDRAGTDEWRCNGFRSLYLLFVQEMQPGVAGLLRVGDVPQLTAYAEFARVTDLAAHFSVKW